MSEYTAEQIQAAMDDLERRGIVTVVGYQNGRKLYKFPDDPEESLRLLRESRAGGQ